MAVRAIGLENFQVEIISGYHTIKADEPIEVGSDDSGLSPYDLLLSGLAACKIITVKMYAKRKGWPLENIELKLSTKKYSCQRL
jgi:uncharacterized OsmC-like protein